MRPFKPVIFSILATNLALSVPACSGKKSGDDDDSSSSGPGSKTPGATSNAANNLLVTGQLTLNLGLTAEEPRSVVLYTLDSRSQVANRQEISVDAEGYFEAPIERNRLAKLESLVNADGTVNRSLAKEVFPEHAAEIEQASDEQLKEMLNESLGDAKQNPNMRYVLISYVKSGDREREAASMQFIGLPTKGAALKMLPGEALKGDTNLGAIVGSGDEAVSTLKAEDSLDLPVAVLEELAAASQTLKILKNDWMNPDARAEVTPWFGYAITDFASTVDKFTTPTKSSLSFGGGGYYIKPRQIDASFGDVCPGNPANPADTSGAPYNASPAKIVEFYPPVEIDSLNSTGQKFGPARPYSNQSVQYRREEQYGEIACSKSSVNNAEGMYTRAKNESDQEFQLQLGESLRGRSPEGIWRLKVAGEEKGRWDLAAAVPYDKDLDPVIYIPAVKIITDGANQARGFEAKFYFFDKASQSYREVLEVQGLKSLLHSFGMDGRYAQTRAGGDLVTRSDEVTLGDDGVVRGSFQVADRALYPCPTVVGSTQCIQKLGFSYFIGSISYRLSIDLNGGL